jgi:hypothetical protein
MYYGQGGLVFSGREHLRAHVGLATLCCWLLGLTSCAGQYAVGKGILWELVRYSTITMAWTMLEKKDEKKDAAAGVTGTSPSARWDHAMAAVGKDIYLFGGFRGWFSSGKFDW